MSDCLDKTTKETLEIEANDTSESKEFNSILKAIECKRAIKKESRSLFSCNRVNFRGSVYTFS